MQTTLRTVVPIPFQQSPSSVDKLLVDLIKEITRSYWASEEGIFEIQVPDTISPFTGRFGPVQFQLVRYTPTYAYDAFTLSMPGRINGDRTLEYGGGNLGKLINDNTISWSNGAVWTRVNRVPYAMSDILDLEKIQREAIRDSKALGQIVEERYYY